MILLIDHYDSFVHNLARYFRRLGCETRVVRSNEIDVESARSLKPNGIVLSPGPKRPEEAAQSIEIIRQLGSEVPLLGVCLGHQAIGVAYGARVVPCEPMHGMASPIEHDGANLFHGMDHPVTVGRYHSLAIDPDSIAPPLVVTAKSADGVIMGIRHQEFPVYGVQYHPESILTDGGGRLIENFAAMTSCLPMTALS